LAANYEILTADGAGNVSTAVRADGYAVTPARIIDDAAPDGLKFTGDWQHQNGLWPAHDHTLSSSRAKGAIAELSFQGREFLLFGKLGANCGQATLRIDNDPAEKLDAYSADDIWGVCLYRKTFATPGPHTLRIEVLGEHGPRAKDSLFPIDGVRIEQK